MSGQFKFKSCAPRGPHSGRMTNAQNSNMLIHPETRKSLGSGAGAWLKDSDERVDGKIHVVSGQFSNLSADSTTVEPPKLVRGKLEEIHTIPASWAPSDIVGDVVSGRIANLDSTAKKLRNPYPPSVLIKDNKYPEINENRVDD